MQYKSTLCLLWLLVFFPVFPDSKDCDYHAAKKQDFTLPLNYVLKKTDQLRWFHESKVIFDRKADKMITGKPDDVHQNGSLRLRNVDESKAGTYTPTVYDDGQETGKQKAMVLCVMGRFQMVLTTVMYCHQVAHDKDGRSLVLILLQTGGGQQHTSNFKFGLKKES